MLTVRATKNLLRGFALSAALMLGGALSNILVEAANHGFMPVQADVCFEDLVIDESHICSGPSTRLAVLDDWIYWNGSIYSIGDGGIIFGQYGTWATLLIMGVVVIPFRRKKK
jgi:hypothetical protein